VDGLSTLDQDHPAASSASTLEYQKEFVMKPYRAFLFGMLVMLLASSLFWAGTAYARTGCFPDTNGHWAEQFICWLKDSGISTGYPDGTFRPENTVTRGELAVMLQRAVNLPPPASSAFRLNVGSNEWTPRGWPVPGELRMGREYTDSYLYVSHSVDDARTYEFVMTPTFPSVLYRRALKLHAITWCVLPAEGAYVNYVAGWSFSPRVDLGGPDRSQQLFMDHYDITKKECPLYEFNEPIELDENMGITLWVGLTWNANSAFDRIGLGSVTLLMLTDQEEID
jgi:hypothetical protein